jgi:hypothetical protein
MIHTREAPQKVDGDNDVKKNTNNERSDAFLEFDLGFWMLRQKICSHII